MLGLDQAGFTHIDLTRLDTQGVTTAGDRIEGAITLYRADGSPVMAADAWLASG